MSNYYKRFFFSAMIAALAALVMLFGIPFEPAHGAPPPPEPTPSPRPLPPNQPARGLIYDGLEPGTDRICRGGFKLRDNNHCTHGPDAAPLGVDVRTAAAPLAPNAPSQVSAIQCDGNGTSGYRTQVMYVRPSDRADRFATYAVSIQSWAASADTIYQDSAAETGGYRRLRFVHDAGCNIIVLNVVIPGIGTVDFNTMVTQLKALGYNSSSRKYMIFFDLNYYCGIGSLYNDYSFAQTNWNNGGPSYARADTSCWSGPVIAHESMHNMGAVQLNAPHTSGGYHCVDEWDRMCYPDSPNYPAMQYVCGDINHSVHDNLFDCNHDDYYHTNPAPGSYLATYWNSANNRFLLSAVSVLLAPRVFLPFVIK